MSLIFDCQIRIGRYVFCKSYSLVKYVTFYSVPMSIRTFYIICEIIEFTTLTTRFEINNLCVCSLISSTIMYLLKIIFQKHNYCLKIVDSKCLKSPDDEQNG